MSDKTNTYYIKFPKDEYYIFCTSNLKRYEGRMKYNKSLENYNLSEGEIKFISEGRRDGYFISKFRYEGKTIINLNQRVKEIYEPYLREFKNLYPKVRVTQKDYILLNYCALIYNFEYEKIICPCGKALVKHQGPTLYDTCSQKCRYEYRDETFFEHIDQELKVKRMQKTKLEKYGDKNFVNMEKRIQTNLKNHGVEHYNNYTQIKKTNKKRYGTPYLFQNEEILKKSHQTNIEKYGYPVASQNLEIAKKISETNKISQNCELVKRNKSRNRTEASLNKFRKRYNIKIKYVASQEYKIYHPYEDDWFEISYTNLNNRLKHNSNPVGTKEFYNFICTINNPIGEFSTSALEKELRKFIELNYKGEIINNYKNKYEIDILLPDESIGFEFNGTYWHSDQMKEDDYHLKKFNYFKNKNIRTISIQECDWINKNKIIKSIILNSFPNNKIKKCYARKCEIRNVDYEDKTNFLKLNHIQGSCNSSINLGLYYDNELISLMTFGKNRFEKVKGGYELIRFCNKINTIVVGGASRLFKHFIRNYNFTQITSFSDIDLFDGKLYRILGFEHEYDTKPSYFYVKDNIKYNRQQFQKHKLVKQGHDPNLTEREIMRNLKYHRIYNCGHKKWIYKN